LCKKVGGKFNPRTKRCTSPRLGDWVYDDEVAGGKQYALVYPGQPTLHAIIGRNKEVAIEEALKIAEKKGTGVVITKEVGVVRKGKTLKEIRG